MVVMKLMMMMMMTKTMLALFKISNTPPTFECSTQYRQAKHVCVKKRVVVVNHLPVWWRGVGEEGQIL